MRAVSAIYWSGVALSSVMLFPVAVIVYLVTRPFDPRGVALHAWTSVWASLYTWCNPWWSVTVDGREKIPRDRPCVLVANHLSVVDILVLFRLFVHFKWVSKKSNFKIPFVGWNMALNRYVSLVRGDRESVAAMFVQCEETLRSGSSVFMFPEGTRSQDGRMKPFKPGAFELALRTGAPVVPIAVQGSEKALPKKGFTIRSARISVTVLDPIFTANAEHDTAASLATHVEATIRAQVEPV